MKIGPKVKVANITLDSRMAGPQFSTVRVGKILREYHNIETIIILPKKESGPFVQILHQNLFDYITLPLDKLSRRPFKAFLWLITFIPQILMLSRAIKKSRVDLVYCSGSWQFKGIIAGKLAGKKVIWRMNDSKAPAVIKFLFKRLTHLPDGFIFTGRRARLYYLNLIKGRVIEKVINAPVDTEHYKPSLPQQASFLKKSKGLKIVTLSNVNPVKGIEHFARAAWLLNKRYDNLHFYVIGGLHKTQRKYIRKIRQLIAQYNLTNFYLTGFRDNVIPVLKDADIYVCASLSEASPLSVWEAMALEKPVVSTDVGTVSEFIKNGENGFVVPVGDSEKMAEKIGYLIDHPQEGRQFGKKAREVVRQKLDISKIAKLYADFFRLILKN